MTRIIKNEVAIIRELPVTPSSKVVEGGLLPLAIRSTGEFEHSATAGVLTELARSSSSQKCRSVEASGVVEHQPCTGRITIAAACKLVENNLPPTRFAVLQLKDCATSVDPAILTCSCAPATSHAIEVPAGVEN